MTALERLCRDAAAGIPGAKAFPGGGLLFRRAGLEGRVDFERDWWEVVFDTQGLAVEPLDVSPAGLWHDVRGRLGFKDLQLDDPAFDAAFAVHGPSEAFAAEVLKPWLRKRMADALRHGGFRWRLTRAGSSLRMPGRPSTAADLDRGLTLAYALLDVLPGADGKDRVQIGVARQRIDAESTCGICGVSLAEGALVRCAACRTPHHGDCWTFNGRCSIFACGGTSTL
jgi:hypothetical protein